MSEQKIQINTMSDRLNGVLYLSNQALLAVGAGLVHPVAAATSLGYVAYRHAAKRKKSRAETQRIYERMDRAAYARLPSTLMLRHLYTLAKPICEKLRMDVPDIHFHRNAAEPILFAALGQVSVRADLFDFPERDERAAGLAHEFAHILAKHGRIKRTGEALGDAAQAGFVAGSVVSFMHGNTTQGFAALAFCWAATKAKSYFDRAYSRSCEYQADRIAAEATSPKALANLLKRLREREILRHGLELVELVERRETRHDHPITPKRIARLEAMQSPAV